MRSLSRGDRSRSLDRYRSHRDRSRRARSRSFDCYRSHRQRTRSPARRGDRSDCSRSHALPSRSRDRSRSRGRQPASPAHSRAGENGRLARRDQQEGAEAVVSQPPAVSEVSVAVTPAAGGAVLSALPSAVQDLARFFLSLSGSSSLGAVGGVADVAAPTAGSGFRCALRLLLLVQSHLVLRLRYLLVLVILLQPAAVPGVSGLLQRQVDSRSRRRRRRSPSGGFDRRSLKRHRWRSLSPVLSSRRRGKYYRSFLVFRGYGSGFLYLTSGRSFIRGASPWSCLLLRLTAVSLTFGLAFAVFCGSGGFLRGY